MGKLVLVDPDLLNICFYKKVWTDEAGYIWVCIVHGQNSKYTIQYGYKLPCLELAPYTEEELF